MYRTAPGVIAARCWTRRRCLLNRQFRKCWPIQLWPVSRSHTDHVLNTGKLRGDGREVILKDDTRSEIVLEADTRSLGRQMQGAEDADILDPLTALEDAGSSDGPTNEDPGQAIMSAWRARAVCRCPT
jgi:hypothetical protein